MVVPKTTASIVDKIITLKNEIKKLGHNIILLLSLFFLGVSIFSSICIIYISPLKFNCSYIGFNNFQEIFSFPLKSFWLFILLLGISIAIKKYQQADVHFYKNHKLTSENIQFNNYFKHIELYVDHMMEYFDYFKNDIAENSIVIDNQFPPNVIVDKTIYKKLTKGYFRNLYYYWFNKPDNDFGKIKNNIFIILLDFMQYISQNKNEIIDSSKHFFKINEFNTKLDLFKFELKLDENEIPYNNFRLKVIIAIIKKSIEFSGQLDDYNNLTEIYNIFCKSKP